MKQLLVCGALMLLVLYLIWVAADLAEGGHWVFATLTLGFATLLPLRDAVINVAWAEAERDAS